MRQPTYEHIAVIQRAISAKETALRSRHVPEQARDQLEHDIAYLGEVELYIYRVMDSVPLYH